MYLCLLSLLTHCYYTHCFHYEHVISINQPDINIISFMDFEANPNEANNYILKLEKCFFVVVFLVIIPASTLSNKIL